MRSIGRFVISCWILIAGCQGSASVGQHDPSVLRLKGSDTMLLLARRWAEEYMLEHPSVAVYVEGGGTAVGVAAMMHGDADWCMASRPLTPEELNQLATRYHSLGYSILAARDALSFYVNVQNPVTEVSTDQLRGIFAGTITNWSVVGGPDEEIHVLRRNSNSGTHLFLEEHILHGDVFRDDAEVIQTTAAMVGRISEDVQAIGYGGLAYAAGVKGLSVDWVSPSPEHVRGGSYSVSRYLYLYAAMPPSGLARRFGEWVLSERGQSIVADVGYVPLYDITRPSADPLPR